MSLTRVLMVASLLAWLCVVARADGVPTLTEVDKLKAQTRVMAWQLATVKAQAAQHEADDAKTELLRYLTTLQRDGYALDLQTLTYVKADTKPEKE